MVFLTDLKIKGSLLGLITGDALGFPYEFLSKEQITEPITGFMYDEHIFTDDSSMTLCTVEALLNHGYNLQEIGKLFQKWFNEGYWSPDGESTIGIGMGVAESLTRMKKLNLTTNPELAGNTYELSNGNGSLMRILPIILYSLHLDDKKLLEQVHAVSSITHAHPRSQMACGIFALFIKKLFLNNDKRTAFVEAVSDSREYYSTIFPKEIKYFERILSCSLFKLPMEDVKTTGYVIDTLEAALWCTLHNSNFEDTLLTAVNLGGDTDTIGAVTGALAGCLYGYSAIPQTWLNKIIRINDATKLIDKFTNLLIES